MKLLLESKYSAKFIGKLAMAICKVTYLSLSYTTILRIDSDDELVTFVNASSRRAIGLGWMFDLTSLPIIGNVADAFYDLWAENRLRLTGRGDLADILAERAEKLREAEPLDECDLDACSLDFGDLE